MSQSHLAISLLLKGLTLTATLTASSVDILASSAKSLLAQLVPNDPALQKKLFFPGFLLPRCQGWQGQQVYWKAQGRSVSPGAIGQPQHCLKAQLRSAQGSRGSSYMSN